MATAPSPARLRRPLAAAHVGLDGLGRHELVPDDGPALPAALHRNEPAQQTAKATEDIARRAEAIQGDAVVVAAVGLGGLVGQFRR